MKQNRKPNHRGFTLVEMVVSTAILGLVAIIAMGLMVTGARTYTSVGSSLRLQYKAQLAMAQLQDALLDCSGGVVWDGSTLAVLDADPERPGDDELRLFRYDSNSQCIYYGSNSPRAATLVSDDLLAEHVTGFSVSLADSTAADHVKSAEVELALQHRNKCYAGVQTIALRNEPLTAAGVSQLLTAVYP